MNEITCDVCMDLIPLVQDGVASQDSVLAVENHIKNCSKCGAIFKGQIPIRNDGKELLKKMKKRAQVFTGMLLMFGILFGLSLTATSELFLNALVMPVLGGIGYYLFRWKAAYIVPCILLVTHIVMNSFGMIRGIQRLSILDVLFWNVLYSFFAILGVIIVGLLHFAFRKEETE